VIRVETPPDLIETLKFLVLAGVPKSNRVAGFTCSGGGATMLADRAEKIGLTFTPGSGNGYPRRPDRLAAAHCHGVKPTGLHDANLG
jgi:hypothetical protein